MLPVWVTTVSRTRTACVPPEFRLGFAFGLLLGLLLPVFPVRRARVCSALVRGLVRPSFGFAGLYSLQLYFRHRGSGSRTGVGDDSWLINPFPTT